MIETIATIAGLMGISAVELGKMIKAHLSDLRKKNKEDLRLRRLELYRETTLHGRHTEAVEKLYPLKDLKAAGLSRLAIKVNGKRIPVAMVGRSDCLLTETEVDLKKQQTYQLVQAVKPVPELSPDIVARSLADIKFFGLKIWNQPIYRLAEIRLLDSDLTAKFSLDTFYSYRLGLGSLWGELMQGLVDVENDTDSLVAKSSELLPRRTQLLRSAENIADYQTRMCVGGIHATVAILRPETDDFVIPIQRRSQIVSGAQNQIGTIPQAFHQPMVLPERELDFANTFYREFYEELLGGEEVAERTQHLCHDWYTQRSVAMKWIQRPDAYYSLLLTGFGFNLFSGNYEAALLCIIRDPNFWTKYRYLLTTNWEATADILPLLSTRETRAIEEMLLRADWVGSGLYSVARGLMYLQRTEASRVEIPEISISLE